MQSKLTALKSNPFTQIFNCVITPSGKIILRLDHRIIGEVPICNKKRYYMDMLTEQEMFFKAYEFKFIECKNQYILLAIVGSYITKTINRKNKLVYKLLQIPM